MSSALCKTGLMKVLPKSMVKNGITYIEGLITDHNKFNPIECQAGGLHYCEENDIMEWFWLGEYVADVTVPHDAQVMVFDKKAKASSIILSNIRHISDYIDSKYPMDGLSYHPAIISWLQSNYRHLKYIKHQTNELCLDMLKQSGYAIQHIKQPTSQHWQIALKMDGSLLHLLHGELESKNNPWSLEVMDMFFRTALSNCGFSIRYVPSYLLTDEYKTLAINTNPCAIYCIKNPSYELCLRAVKLNFRALSYITPTKELCIEALKQSPYALEYVPTILRGDADIDKLIKKYTYEIKKNHPVKLSSVNKLTDKLIE